jgi:hypothetical protein
LGAAFLGGGNGAQKGETPNWREYSVKLYLIAVDQALMMSLIEGHEGAMNLITRWELTFEGFFFGMNTCKIFCYSRFTLFAASTVMSRQKSSTLQRLWMALTTLL